MQNGNYTELSEDKFTKSLEALYKIMDLPVRLTDAKGQTLLKLGDEKKYCRLLHQQVFVPAVCSELYRRAELCAQRLGEAYVFTCPGNLYHIAYPLKADGEFLGSVRIGPFLMDVPESTLVEGVMENFPFSSALALDLYDELSEINVLQPERVTDLGNLLSGLLFQGLAVERKSPLSKKSPPMTEDLLEMERALLNAVRVGDLSLAEESLKKWLDRMQACASEQLETVRLRMLELGVLISRAALEGGAETKSVYALCDQELPKLERQQDFRALSEGLHEILAAFMDQSLSVQDKGNVHIRQALHYISRNLAQPLTVAETARKLNLSPGYFAELFREIVGESFHSYLMRMRVKESKRLLLSTQDSLTEIALKLGFTDQSYFCRVFRRFEGTTPGKYRN